jgi:hypothetical protein
MCICHTYLEGPLGVGVAISIESEHACVMYVYMYVCMYICMYYVCIMYVYVSMYVCMYYVLCVMCYVCMYVCMYVCVYYRSPRP